MMRRAFLWMILGISWLGGSAPCAAATTNTAGIIADTAAALPRCLNWRLDGTCMWLQCKPYACWIETRVRVRNYTPDAVVTVRNNIDSNPWSEMSPLTAASNSVLLGLTSGLADANGNSGSTNEANRDRRHLVFRDADVFGHPLSAASFLGAAAVAGPVCLPRTVPLFPYFQSGLDALVWREITPVESLYPAALVPGMREIGNFPANTWGSVHPRVGTIVHPEEPKAAAVIAQRAGDIVTRDDQPHVYVPLSYGMSDNGYLWWDPDPLLEDDEDTGVWQMLKPHLDSACYTFGENDSASLVGWADDRKDDAGDYVFNLWRPYSCCEETWGLYIGYIPGALGSAIGYAINGTGISSGSGSSLSNLSNTLNNLSSQYSTITNAASAITTATAVYSFATSSSGSGAGNPACPASITWQDEFDQPLSASRTGQGTRYATEYPWGDSGINNELQYYGAPEQAPVFQQANGVLSITAFPVSPPLVSRVTGQSFHYASGLLHTENSFARSRGLWEMRAKLPKGRGLWPAFWLVPTVKPAGYWRNPEIDIFEVLGHDTTTLYATMHTKTPPSPGGHVDGNGYTVYGTDITTADLSAGWHVYGLEITDTHIVWYLDGAEIKRELMPDDFRAGQWYLLANLAVGGDWPGNPDNTTPFPARYEMDWIRFSERPATCAGATPAGSSPTNGSGVAPGQPIIVSSPVDTTGTCSGKSVDKWPASRNLLEWPFASDSIWNMPIGCNVRYINAQLDLPDIVDIDEDVFVVARSDDPIVPAYKAGGQTGGGTNTNIYGSNTDRCSGTVDIRNYNEVVPDPSQAFRVNMPTNYVLASRGANYSTAILMPDGENIRQLNAFARCTPGGPIYGLGPSFATCQESVRGNGMSCPGGHGGTAMSSIGGSLRAMDFASDEPIRHALKVNLRPWQYYLNRSTGQCEHRWPAFRCDNDIIRYGGMDRPSSHVHANREGALLAILPTATPESLGITTPAGRKMFDVLQDYGVYTVDGSGTDTDSVRNSFSATGDAEEAFERHYGHPFRTYSGGGSAAAASWKRDIQILMSNLHVVDDNSPSCIGGCGDARRRPMAP